MNIKRYAVTGFVNSDLKARVDFKHDETGKWCSYNDVLALEKEREKLQLALELLQRREKMLMEMLDEAYRNQVVPKKVERTVDVES